MTEIEKIFTSNLKKIRKEQGLTQNDLAELCEVDQPTVQRWERGKTWPQPKYIEALAKALKISQNELFQSEERDIQLKEALGLICKKLRYSAPRSLGPGIEKIPLEVIDKLGEVENWTDQNIKVLNKLK